jgi:hypothetical protein
VTTPELQNITFPAFKRAVSGWIRIMQLLSNGDWNSRSAKEITMTQSRVPTGCVMDWMADYAFIGYAKGNLILNKTIAEKLQIELPDSFVKKAARIIE